MAGGFVRDEKTMYSIPLRFAEQNLTHCPFCHAQEPRWLVKEAWKFLGRDYYFLCPECESILKVSQEDVTGLSFTTVSMAGKWKKYKGKDNRTIYVTVDTIGFSARTQEDVIYQGADIPLGELMKL